MTTCQQPVRLHRLEVEFGEEEAPDWLPDPYTLAWPNTVAVCAMMKDEHPQDVQEFLEYHRRALITHAS